MAEMARQLRIEYPGDRSPGLGQRQQTCCRFAMRRFLVGAGVGFGPNSDLPGISVDPLSPSHGNLGSVSPLLRAIT
jgi:hypothetical protein